MYVNQNSYIQALFIGNYGKTLAIYTGKMTLSHIHIRCDLRHRGHRYSAGIQRFGVVVRPVFQHIASLAQGPTVLLIAPRTLESESEASIAMVLGDLRNLLAPFNAICTSSGSIHTAC